LGHTHPVGYRELPLELSGLHSSGLLLLVSHLFAVPVLILWVRLEKSN
jgi:hypothetical protein